MFLQMTFISDTEHTKFYVRDSKHEMHLILKLLKGLCVQ